jgi:uncharacterized protein
MTGETDLTALLRHMQPVLFPDPYGFALVNGDVPAGLRPFATMAEEEGLTLVAPVSALRAAGVEPGPDFARITLTVHSALAAVGLTAAFARALADRGISANVIAGFHHDHIFVGWDDRDAAVEALLALSGGAVV